MVGRGACGRPWLLRQIMDFLATGRYSPAPSFPIIQGLLLEHYDSLLLYYGIENGVRVARKHIGWYVDRMEGAEDFRSKVFGLTDPEMVKSAIRGFFDQDFDSFSSKFLTA